MQYCFIGNITLSNYSRVTSTRSISTKVLNMSKTQQFRIIGQRNALGSVKNKFITCRRGKAQTIDPVMAYPHTERLDALTPFAYIRVDYFGPFTVKFGHRNEKGRCFLFSSLTVRAADVEIVPKVDLDSCLNAIMRFIARRGKPVTIISDKCCWRRARVHRVCAGMEQRRN